MTRYFFYIRYLPDLVNNEFLAGKCIRILHAYQTRFDLRVIGVTFPDWSVETVGRTIVFVSECKKSLSTLRLQNYFTRMMEEGYFALSEVQELFDDQVLSEVIFYRERRLEKQSPNSRARNLKRLQKRAMARGEEYSPVDQEQQETVLMETHQLPCGSSGGHDFSIYVGMTECGAAQYGPYSSYGLGYKSQQVGTVPCLKPFLCGDKLRF